MELQTAFDFQIARDTELPAGGSATFTVSRRWDTTVPASVTVATRDDSVVAERQHQPLSETVTWEAGETGEKQVTVQTPSDRAAPGNHPAHSARPPRPASPPQIARTGAPPAIVAMISAGVVTLLGVTLALGARARSRA